MMLKNLLRRDTRGIGAVEFALVAPVLISFVIGISQVGKLFYASADMKNALASGARAASVYPVPGPDAVIAVVKDRIARTGGVGDATVTVPVEKGVDANGNEYMTIKMEYKVPVDFIFFDVGQVTLSETRTVYRQMESPWAPSGGGGTSTSTSGGEDTSTSTTSAGGTTSTSTTSAGGTTSTSATSASSTTSSTTSSGNGNGNGNSNGNSNHGHGNCKNNCG